jgi:hypothetical protein
MATVKIRDLYQFAWNFSEYASRDCINDNHVSELLFQVEDYLRSTPSGHKSLDHHLGALTMTDLDRVIGSSRD